MAKEKSTAELADEKAQLIKRFAELKESAEKEERMIQGDDLKEVNKIQLRMAEIGIEMADLQSRSAQIPTGSQKKEKRFSIASAILQAAENRGFSQEVEAVCERGKAQSVGLSHSGGLILPMESRAAFVAGTDANGGYLKETDLLNILDPLKAKLILTQVGASFIGGLKNNVTIPKYSGTTSAWAAENGAAADGAGTFSTGSFSPKRLTSKITISKGLLVQDNFGIEQYLINSIVDSINAKLEATVFGKDATATTKPDGFFTGTAPTDAGALTWARIVAMETGIDTSNALEGNLAYVMHPALKGKCKTTIKSADAITGFISEIDGSINGYKALSTSNVASGLQTGTDEYGIIFGNWADFGIYQWGGLDLTVDPYTAAGTAQLVITINSYWDFGQKRTESFAKASMK